MSAEATGWVFRHSPYTGDRFILHLAIADATDDLSDPPSTFGHSVAALARKARCSERTVQYGLRDMEDRGLVEVLAPGGGRGRPTRYRFLFPAPETVQDVHPSETVQTQEHESSALVVPEEPEEPAVAPFPVAPIRPSAPRPVKASSGPAPRRRDPIWDAVVEVCRLDTARMTASERTHIGKIVRELKEVGATADEIKSFARWWATEYRGARLTPPTITKHWSARGTVSGVTTAPDYNPATAWMYQ